MMGGRRNGNDGVVEREDVGVFKGRIFFLIVVVVVDKMVGSVFVLFKSFVFICI